jgi:hypothetical protein
MKQVPADAKQLPMDVVTSGLVDVATAKQYAWTTVPGTATQKIQTQDGMGKGQPYYEVAFQCPRCEDNHTLHSTNATGEHPVRCFCSGRLVFVVKWG